jgi:hypothetical protein
VSSSLRPLRIAAAVELVSLLVLLINLATVHWRAVASLVGPTHGCAYLLVIILTARRPETTTATRATAVLPGIGGLLALRRLASPHAARAAQKQAGRGGPNGGDQPGHDHERPQPSRAS